MRYSLNTFSVLMFVFALTACGVPQADYDILLSENQTLKFELDEMKNGEKRLIAIIEQSYSKKMFKDTKEAYDKLKTHHPQSSAISKYSLLMIKINKEEKATKARLDAEKKVLAKKLAAEERSLKLKLDAEAKEKIRLANLNNTGMWQVTHYVDDFGDPTKQGYIRNLSLIRGQFSNSATEDSELDVRLLINSKTNVDLFLYEYASNNPVKAYSPDEYKILLQDKDGTRHTLKAFNRNDRLSFGPKHSAIVTNALLKAGRVKFRIIEVETPTTQYSFDIVNAQYFDNALRLLSEPEQHRDVVCQPLC